LGRSSVLGAHFTEPPSSGHDAAAAPSQPLALALTPDPFTLTFQSLLRRPHRLKEKVTVPLALDL